MFSERPRPAGTCIRAGVRAHGREGVAPRPREASTGSAGAAPGDLSKPGPEPRPQADGDVGFALGGLTLLLKPLAGPGGAAEKSPYPRLTVAVADAPRMERELAARGVKISDAVQLYEDGRYWVGAFLDSEGNKLWFCSEAGKPAPSVSGGRSSP